MNFDFLYQLFQKMSYKIKVVSDIEGFNNIFDEFQEDCKLVSTPEYYHVGFDIEYIADSNYPESFNKITNQKKNNIAICIIQLSSAKSCLILEIHKFKQIPRQLKALIVSQVWIKTGVGIANDLQICMNNFQIEGIPSFLDISVMERLDTNNSNTSYKLESIIERKLNHVYNKPSGSIRDWSLELNEKTLRYCVHDAYYSWFLALNYIPFYNNKHIQPLNIDDVIRAFSLKEVEENVVTPNNPDTLLHCNVNEDYVSKLQMFCQKHSLMLPNYTTLPHGKCFQTICVVPSNNKIITKGIGSNKKLSKMKAAKYAYTTIKATYK